jgi:hypothetical protein
MRVTSEPSCRNGCLVKKGQYKVCLQRYLMSKKKAQHWYQIHKSKSGRESVENSKAVAEARLKVRSLEAELRDVSVGISDTVFSAARRLLIGRNAQEQRAHKVETDLRDAQSVLRREISDARTKGEGLYASDWVSRNPDKAKY